MRVTRLPIVACFVGFCALSTFGRPRPAAPPPPSPSEFLGFAVGSDRQLADYRQIVSYLKTLAASSPRIEIENIGPSTLGNEMIIAAISSSDNLKSKKKYQEIARKLADPRGLSRHEIDELAREGKAIVLVTCNIHASEIGASQMAMEWAHDLVTAQDPETRHRLEQVILLLVPSLNPDGQIMETEWYRKNLGTKYEGSRLPWLYHHYVGHDNNRDWYMLTQKETKAVTRAVYFEWFPQVWLDEHQMGSAGPRIFVPPYTEPIASRIDPLIWRGVNEIGATMAWRLEQHNKSGVIYGYSYDSYWPGATEGTAQWKNIFGLLTETASARLATPIDIPATELSGSRKGLIDYGVQANYPNPWPGGRWGLRDIIEYEHIASDALLETCATHREDFLKGVATMAMNSIKLGAPDKYYRIPSSQRDPVTAARLAHLLREHAVEVKVNSQGDFLVPTAQPYARFVDEMLNAHRYPKVRPLVGSPIFFSPYDVTTWSLPLMMGVEVETAKLPPSEGKSLRPISDADWPAGGLEGGSAALYAVSHQENNVTRLVNAATRAGLNVSIAREGFVANRTSFPAGTILVEPGRDLASLASKYHLKLHALPERPSVAIARLREVRVGLYKPWLASMDEGWTRWVLEQYEFNLKNVDNKAIKAGKLNEGFDAIVLPDTSREIIVDGKPKVEEGMMKYWEEPAPEYAGGIGRDGVAHLKDFVDKGGTLIALGTSGDLLAEEFNLPVRNVLAKIKPEEFSCPGSILRVHVDPTHPVAYGMPSEAGAFLTGPIAYETAIPGTEIERSVVASYPSDSEDILISGWIKGPERLERRAAVVAFKQGQGKLVLLGFRVQHRAQTEGTFKLLFNAIHWAGIDY